MSIFTLPVFEQDADPANRSAMTDQEIYERLEAPTSIVVRYSSMRMVAEYPYNGDAKPGCGSKLVARTHRGTEITEMLTSTCPNAGCAKSVSRKEMLEYIDNSGGKDYPFRKDGRILRVATIDDLNRWSSIQSESRQRIARVRALAEELELDMKLVEIEPVLSEEMLTIYYMSEERIDFRELVRRLGSEYQCRIEMKQVGARDEARLTADYERCGQHCCCSNFLKVLKPVSMRSAKTQKATLDPLKISGRCGRLMCCLRYEDETYSELKKRLPKRKSHVGTPMGPGIVLDTKILVQLALVRLDATGEDVAVPIEELCDPDACPPQHQDDPLRGMDPKQAEARTDPDKRKKRRKSTSQQQDAHREASIAHDSPGSDAGEAATQDETKPGKKKRRRRRRRRKGGDANQETAGDPSADTPTEPRAQDASAEPGSKKKKKRRRRRRRKRGGDGDAAPPENP